MVHTGRHFLQIPGPTNVPERVLRAIDQAVIDHRGPEFAALGLEVLDQIRHVFQTAGPVVIYPSSGTGACEAALANTLSPGDAVLVCESGWFSQIAWAKVAQGLGLLVEQLPGDWRRGVSPEAVEDRLRADRRHDIKAVVVVHNETSTGVTNDVADIHRAVHLAGHPALLIVDTISSLGSIDYRHDEWGVDVSVSGSQKGLMLPPGLAFNAVSPRALAANKTAKLPRSYWNWEEMLKSNASGFFPYTPATNLLFGLRESLRMLREEGLANVFERHRRHGAAARAAVEAWGLQLVCQEPSRASNALTAVLMPDDHDADRFRAIVLDKFDMSLGAGLGKLSGRAFRIGHLGAFNDLTLAAALSGVEMGMRLADVPHRAGGVMAALDVLTSAARSTHVLSDAVG
jgi:alanine-glyoxylate transaminase/serine-glyoxylate transaminase/serine-pyruvate transaminase